MVIDRRGLLVGGAALLVGSHAAIAAPPMPSEPAVRALLNRAATLARPEERLALLAGARRDGLSPASALDLDSALFGARIEADIARLFPFTGELGTPYPVTPREGAWRRVESADVPADMAERIRRDTDRIDTAARAGVALPQSILPDVVGKLGRAYDHAADRPTALALEAQRAALIRATAATPPGDGIGRLPGGAQLYALLLELQAGERVAPGDAHAEAIDRARAVTARLDRLLRRQGMASGSVASRLRALARDPRYLYAGSGAGRDAAVADMNRWLAAARGRLGTQFLTIPEAAAAVTARRMTPEDEAAGRAGYRVLPAIDGSAPGAYYVDLHDIRARPSWTLPSVVHHELLPGHMIQLPLQQQAKPHPLRLRAAPGFVEGWAIHAEQLADESGAFASDPLAEIGYLYWMLFRLGRSIVDTGINHAGWSRAQAIAYLGDLQGDPVIFAPFASDVERSCLEPGGQAGQALNWFAFIRLREAARRSDGHAFDQRHFYDRMLRAGAAPMHVLSSNLT